MKLFKSVKALVIFALLSTSQINSQEAKVLPSGSDNNKCSFKELEEMFGHYSKYFFELYYSDKIKKDWTILNKKYNCEDVFKDLYQKDRKRIAYDFNIVQNNDGIKEGYVIAYGRYLFPPYQINEDYDNLELFINGIQIWPLLRPDPLEPSQYEKLSQKKFEAIDNINNSVNDYVIIFKQILDNAVQWQLENNGKEKAQSLLDLYLSRSKQGGFIDDYTIYDKDNLKYEIFLCDRWGIGLERKTIEERRREYIEDKYFKKDINNNPIVQDQDDSKIEFENKKKFIKSITDEIIKLLNNNSILVFSSGYTDFSPFHSYDSSQLQSICKAMMSGKDDYHKLIMLKDIDSPRGTYKVSKEIVMNFIISDCDSILKRIKGKEGAANE